MDVLTTLMNDKRQPGQVKVAAARALSDLRQKQVAVRKPTSVAQVEAMSRDELHDLIRRLEAEGNLPADIPQRAASPERVYARTHADARRHPGR